MSLRRPPGRHRAPSTGRRWVVPAATAGLVAAVLAGAVGVAALTGGPELQLSLRVVAAEVAPGDDAIVVAELTNAGREPAEDVTLTASLPPRVVPSTPVATAGRCQIAVAVRCSLGVVAPGERVRVEIGAGVITPGALTFQVEVSSAEGGTARSLAVRSDGPACQVVGTAGDDDLGTRGDGSIVCGLAGDDQLRGGPGDDLLVGGSGIDLASYADADGGVRVDLGSGASEGWGDDVLRSIEGAIGSPFDDAIVGGDGADLLRGESGDDELGGGPGDDAIDGGDGRDRLDLSAALGKVLVNLLAGKARGQGSDLVNGVEDVVGSRFGDALQGDASDNGIDGGPGDDILNGLAGDDRLDGGEGGDTLTFAGASSGVVADLAAGTVDGQGVDRIDGLERVRGSRHADVLRGTDGPDRLLGEDGADVLTGGGGDDVLLGGDGADSLGGGDGRDDLDGGSGSDGCVQEETDDLPKLQCELEGFAEWDGMVLYQMSSDVIGVGYHESLFDTAVDLRPLGTLETNANPGKFPPIRDTDGPPYVIMDSRGRPTGATTSVDIVVSSHSEVRSPVTGVVAEVVPYRLYCKYPDYQVLIEPAGRPDLLVMVLHITGVPVSEGNRVIGGVTPIGTSWGNDAPDSQENDYFDDQYPHTHVELEAATSVGVPGCF
jgi:hypothetical protein